jgi:hypothetical protein
MIMNLSSDLFFLKNGIEQRTFPIDRRDGSEGYYIPDCCRHLSEGYRIGGKSDSCYSDSCYGGAPNESF